MSLAPFAEPVYVTRPILPDLIPLIEHVAIVVAM